MSLFRPASRHKIRGRLAIDGPAGSGKTFTALRFASAIGQRIAVINTESGAVEKYLGLVPDEIPWQFDVCELTDYSPSTYTAAIMEAGRSGYDVLIIDSLSHAWEGSGGALELVDKIGDKTHNRFTAWKDVTPMHRRMVDAMLRSPCHVIATMRSKMEYVLEADEKGRMVPRKVGLAPIQRAGMEYEFDVVADIDISHRIVISKSRCPEIDGMIAVKPGIPFIQPFVSWLNDGSDTPAGYYTANEGDLKKMEAPQKPAAPASMVSTGVARPSHSLTDRDPVPDDLVKTINQQIDEIAKVDAEYPIKVAGALNGRVLSSLSFGEAIKLAVKINARHQQITLDQMGDQWSATPAAKDQPAKAICGPSSILDRVRAGRSESPQAPAAAAKN